MLGRREIRPPWLLARRSETGPRRHLSLRLNRRRERSPRAIGIMTSHGRRRFIGAAHSMSLPVPSCLIAAGCHHDQCQVDLNILVSHGTPDSSAAGFLAAEARTAATTANAKLI
ncbi:hypothetical protein PsYK624_172250 [Phanerochaete sordida]|uniref:Uncharacterized protein n=1 Tax=Phanerochaete sordida TaxID=48140 RepID=A0A9P3GZ28_9APHY|nr:hypothetical protein PsYK624_172250 [Phanerochaete sordida]